MSQKNTIRSRYATTKLSANTQWCAEGVVPCPHATTPVRIPDEHTATLHHSVLQALDGSIIVDSAKQAQCVHSTHKAGLGGAHIVYTLCKVTDTGTA